ncbi:hypothetical protein HC762_01945 [bacterium]|nr:hypothetical protein [bacterium]
MQHENWLSVDEATDVLGSLRHCLRCRDIVQDDKLAWKWFMLALHSALQGACVCHLTTTAQPVGPLTKRNTEEWLAWFDCKNTGPAPKVYLLALPDLLKKVRKENSAGDGSNSFHVRISDQDLAWLTSFHEILRNQFVHFEPMGWSVELSGLPGLSRLVARIIGDISKCGWGFRHLNEEQKADMVYLLTALSDW